MDDQPGDEDQHNRSSAQNSDDEANDDAVVGNVNQLCVTPPMYEGKPKRGHLIFDASFEGGNLGRVDYISDFEFDLFIRPDTCNQRFRVWFHFSVENALPDQRVIFTIVNFSKTKSLYRDGMTPVVRSTSRSKWTRLPPKHVYYYRCPDHHRNYVLSFAFCFDKAQDVYEFAYCFPYTYSRLQSYLGELESQNLDFLQRESLTLSVQQRRLDLLTITHPENRYRANKRIVFITARVHPGETPASFVCQGFIYFIVSQHPLAQLLRQHIVFKIVPMLNPDGVFLGNYRCSLMGFDLNRHWQDPSPWAQPTIFACKSALIDLYDSKDAGIEMFCDLHAHSTLTNGFMYGNVVEDQDKQERQSLFPKLFHQNAEDFSIGNTNFNRDALKAGTGRRALASIFNDNVLCYTLEVSFYSFSTSPAASHQPYTEESYAKLGRNFGRTLADYFRCVAVLPAAAAAAAAAAVVKETRSSERRFSELWSSSGRNGNVRQKDAAG